MTEHLGSYLRNTLAGSPDGVVTFQWMTDEETAAIETDDESELTVQPWIESHEDLDASLGARFGERSLFMRGLLEMRPGADSGEPELVPSEELRLVSDARRLGIGYLLARATHPDGRAGLNNVIQPHLGTFEEEIDENGIHLFSACTYATAVSRLAGWALPDAQHGGAQMRTRISMDRWQVWLLNELGVDVRVVELNLFLPGPSGDLAAEVWMLAHAHGIGVLGSPDGQSLQVTSMTTSRLEDTLRGRLESSLGVAL